jgi:hypothetical protein
MRILCSTTPYYVVGGGPVFLLMIETPATVMAVIAIAISPTIKTVAYPLDLELKTALQNFRFSAGAPWPKARSPGPWNPSPQRHTIIVLRAVEVDLKRRSTLGPRR